MFDKWRYLENITIFLTLALLVFATHWWGWIFILVFLNSDHKASNG